MSYIYLVIITTQKYHKRKKQTSNKQDKINQYFGQGSEIIGDFFIFYIPWCGYIFFFFNKKGVLEKTSNNL